MQQREIRVAWENFLEKGLISGELPKVVATSWQRSRHLGIGAESREAPLAGEAEVFRRRSQNSELVSAARPALERSAVFLAEGCSMMVLSDASGFILETAGDPRIVDAGRRNHLEIGGQWGEGAIGTNAIGTALAESRPVQICGAEHFCADVQRWTCAAKPVFHPIGGELLGVVDISGAAASFNPQSFALAVAIGQEIEASLGRVAKWEHEILLRQFLAKRSIWISEEITVVDRRGAVVHAPEAAQGPFEQNFRDMIGGAPDEVWEDNCRRLFPNARVEVVRSEGVALGCMIVMPNARSRSSSRARSSIEPTIGFDQILGESKVMRDVTARARKLAANTLPILIEGETGVGKELFARAIKEASPAARGPFVPVNCGGMARDLVASELFGYAKGAFTGADANGRQGKIEKADGGVLCLDEIGEMPLDLQSYFLRALEDGVVYRIGEHEGRRVKMRLVSMTNRDLTAEVDGGRFRRDLYYRIAAARVRIPPLRERGDDVILLARHFASKAAERQGRPAPAISDEAAALLMRYSWPGNVRELRNVVDNMLALSESDRLDVDDLPMEIRVPSSPPVAAAEQRRDGAFQAPASVEPFQGDLKASERATIIAQVKACGGNLTAAARRLGIARSTLYVRLQQYGEIRSKRT